MEMTRRNFVATAAAGTTLAAAATTAVAGTALAEDAAQTAQDVPAWLGTAPEIADSEIASTVETGLLIVGAGNAGMSAAATAADLGLDFMICEKNEAICETRFWFGAVDSKPQQDAGVVVDKGKLLNELTRYASGKCRQDVWNVWINESGEFIDWLSDMAGQYPSVDTVGFDHPTGGTDFYTPEIEHSYGMAIDRNQLFYAHIQELGYDVTFGYDLKRLVVDESGAVTGAIFETDEGYVRVNAENTLLTTGGYAANPEMVKACNPVVDLCVTAPGYVPGNKGEGIKAALWAGAVKDPEGAPMIFDRGAVFPGQDAGYDENDAFASQLGGFYQFGLGSQPFMKVNRHGRRFANESCPYDFICQAASRQPGGVWCQVFDANMAQDVARFSTVGCSKSVQKQVAAEPDPSKCFANEIEGGFLMQADTLDELADKLGFTGADKEAFLAQVDEYNGYYDAQKDGQFGKEDFRLSEIRTAPFFGCWFGGTLLTTIDGIQIDANMRALGADSEPIPGLFAAGDCSGSLFCGNYPEYQVGCACGRSITFGRHAVRYIAGDLA